jgi:hypothetical protein
MSSEGNYTASNRLWPVWIGDRPLWWIERRHDHEVRNLDFVSLRGASAYGAGSFLESKGRGAG